MEKNFEEFSNVYLNLLNQKKDFVTVQIVDTKGSAPQDKGARIIICDDEICFGTVGGGKLEAFALDTAKELSNDKYIKNKLIKVNLQKDIGMTCGGEVSLYFELEQQSKKFKVNIFGAGHVSQELNYVLSRLECSVTCIDNRQEWLDKLSPLNIKTICLENMDEYVENCDPDSFNILMTMGHATDAPILAKFLLSGSFSYLGVIGSEAKKNSLKKDMRERGLNEDQVKNFDCPIGMNIGNNSPAEIAISIVGSLLERRDRIFQTEKRN
jgi:xanthine dehydrogenase accessory factor